MKEQYNKKQAKRNAARYRSILSDTNTGELAWKRTLPMEKWAGVRDGPQYIEEGQFKNWEEVDAFSASQETGGSSQPGQTLPEDHGNRAVVVGQTPSATVYFRKKYFRTLASTAGWTPTFQAAVTNLLLQKSMDIASVEALTKFRYMYGFRNESSGTLTRDTDGNPIGKEYNHYRTYWYGDNVGNYPGGIMEITNFSQISTSLTTGTAELGSCSITIEDPYNLLFVSKRDIDRLFKKEVGSDDPALLRKTQLENQIAEAYREYNENVKKIKSYKISDSIEVKTQKEFKEELQKASSGVLNTGGVREQPSGSASESKLTPQDQKDLAALENLAARQAELGDLINKWKSELADPSLGDSTQSYNKLDTPPPKPIAQLKTGEYVYYKRDIDYLYQYVVGRPIFSVMDEIYVWMSPVKEDLFSFSVVDDLVQRLESLGKEKKFAQKELEASGADADANSQRIKNYESSISNEQREAWKKIVAKDASKKDAIQQRINGIDSESQQLMGRLRMFGYTFDKNGDIAKEPDKHSQLNGFVLKNGIQVFSGLVSGVAESWNDGVYTIDINASNNFKFMDMSRLPPAGSMVDVWGLLDTPVARIEVEGEKIKWNWLWGAKAMSGFAPSSNVGNDADLSKSRIYGRLQARSIGLDMRDRFFGGYDAANVITTILCGLIFDPDIQLAISIPDDDHEYYRSNSSALSSTPIPNSFPAQFRVLAEIENKALGDFIPFASVPADLLAYHMEEYADGMLFHFGDPKIAQETVYGKVLKETKTAPLTKNDSHKKYIKQFIGKSKKQISDMFDLQNYYSNLNKAKDSLENSVGQMSDKKDKLAAYEDELSLVKTVLQQNLSNSGVFSPFKISDVIKDYPSAKEGDSYEKMMSKAGEALTYRDAQQYLLINKQEDIIRNIDQTYLSIDMTYLISPAARAFTVNIRNTDGAMWKSERLSQLQLLKEVADQLDWELFGDSQGNIIFRRRQFNSIPASVYKRKLVPYLSRFVKEVLAGKSFVEWNVDTSWEEKNKALVKYLPGIDLAWVLVYQSPYLRAQILELDYPVADYDDEEAYTKELLGNSDKLHDESSSTVDPRARYHVYITDADIISWSFSENEAPISRVDINGGIDNKKAGADPTTLLITALSGAAVDYDLWYHYGYRKDNVNKAWLRDANKQIPSYALSYLAHAKAKILRGTVTVVGNPFYQPGEVVYIESRNMLYYVTKVSHSFSYGGEFHTTLTLEFGHSPGYWIADPYYLEATSYASGFRIYDKSDVANYEKEMEIYRNSITTDIISGHNAALYNIGSETLNSNGDKYRLACLTSASSVSLSAVDLVKHNKPNITSTFDPAIIDRLRASKFFESGSGINYEKMRRDEDSGES